MKTEDQWSKDKSLGGVNPWSKDDTLKVTHHKFDQKEMMVAVKLLGIMGSSLLLISLIVTGLGIYLFIN